MENKKQLLDQKQEIIKKIKKLEEEMNNLKTESAKNKRKKEISNLNRELIKLENIIREEETHQLKELGASVSTSNKEEKEFPFSITLAEGIKINKNYFAYNYVIKKANKTNMNYLDVILDAASRELKDTVKIEKFIDNAKVIPFGNLYLCSIKIYKEVQGTNKAYNMKPFFAFLQLHMYLDNHKNEMDVIEAILYLAGTYLKRKAIEFKRKKKEIKSN
jgi:hypothetical protein